MKTHRIMIAKPGLDGHDRGAKFIARALRDAGFEVIYSGIRQTPEAIVSACLQEDVAALGLSSLSGAHNHLFPRVAELLKKEGGGDIILFGGGVIPNEDVASLKKAGFAQIFTPGASSEDVVEFLKKSLN